MCFERIDVGLLLFCQFFALFVKQMIDVSGQECDYTAVDHVGTLAEILTHLTAAVFRIRIDGGLHQQLILFVYVEGDVEGLVAFLFIGTVHGNAAAFEVQIAKCAGQATVEDRRQQVAFQLLRDDRSTPCDGIQRLIRLVLARFLDQSAVQHIVKCLGKIKVHDIVGLHYNVVERYEVERIIDVSHQIKDENFDVVHASNG